MNKEEIFLKNWPDVIPGGWEPAERSGSIEISNLAFTLPNPGSEKGGEGGTVSAGV